MGASSPCAIVIFGASGDLAKRKLIPALYELAREGLLNDATYLMGFSRSGMSDQQYRQESREAVEQYARTKPVDMTVWGKLEGRLHYFQGDYGSADAHERLARTLSELDEKYGNSEKNR